jgi:tagatose 6-phosphate kinase
MTFDRVVIDDVNRAIEVREYASGKSPNVARVLRTMGEDPLAVGFAGGDRGKFLLDDLGGAGVRCDFVAVPEQTRLCTTVIDRSAGVATELVEEHAPVSPAAWDQMDRKLRELLPRAKFWIFSGSLPPGAPQDFYARWVPLARMHGATLILDARGEPLELALAHGGFIAKLNRDELAATLGTSLENDDALIRATRRIVPAGGAAIITLGSKGAVASDGNRVWYVTPPKVKAISAVGSGDSFAAGFALGLRSGGTLPEAMALGAACGAANAMTALAGHLSASDVEELRLRVKVSEVF